MRIFNDPNLIVSLAPLITSTVGTFAQAGADRSASEAEAIFLETQARQEQIASARELRDLEKERRRRLARTRAILAAGGQPTTEGTSLALLRSQAAEFATREARIRQDTRVTQSSLLTRAGNVRRAGRAQRQADIFGGVATAAAGTASLLRRRAKTKE